MRHFPTALLLATALLASPSLAAPGLRLSWDRCAADGRVANRDFACDTNAGSDEIVFSYEPPASYTGRTGIEMTFHIQTSTGVLPAWWEVRGAGACRAGAISLGAVGDAGSACTDPYQGQAAGGIAGYGLVPLGPSMWQLLVAVAVPSANAWTIAPGNEYFGVRLVLNHAATTGAGACTGCQTPMCIGIGKARLSEPTGQDALTMYAGNLNTGGGTCTVTWQRAYVREYMMVFERVGDYAEMLCDPDNSIPARASTWAAVKALYR